MVDQPFARGRSDVFVQDVADGCVLFDPAAEKVYVLNVSAAFVWTCLDGRHSVDDIIRELADALGSGAPDKGRLRADVLKSLADFRAQGLLASP